MTEASWGERVRWSFNLLTWVLFVIASVDIGAFIAATQPGEVGEVGRRACAILLLLHGLVLLLLAGRASIPAGGSR